MSKTGLVGSSQWKRSVRRPNHNNIKVYLRIAKYEELSGKRWGPTAGFCEHSAEPSDSIDSEL
jgi:hypothetical protein